jgi:beta-carotene hydroxylase
MPSGIHPARPPSISQLGVDLLRVTNWQLIRALATPFVSCAAYWPLAASGHWYLAVLSLVILSFATYGSTSHDLVHRNLGLNPFLNDLLLSVIELIALRSGQAYRAAHLHHHARFPHDDDIEAEAARMSLPRALCEGVIFQFRIYGWALNNSRRRRRWIVAEGFALLAMFAGAISAVPFTIVPGVYIALMIAGSWTIPLITSYVPHDASAPDALHQTRRFRGHIARFLAFDHLYHLEHHLYPAVPHQNWARLARRLDPWFDAAGIESVRIGF